MPPAIPPELPLPARNAAATAALVAVVLGLASCFAGYRLFRLFLAFYGFALGALLGVALAAAEAPGNDFAAGAGLLVGGLAGAGLLSAFYLLGVFAVGALGGLILAEVLHLHAALGDLGPALTALACGVLALFLQKIVIALSTAFSGAWGVLGGLVALLGRGPAALADPFVLPPGAPWRGLPDHVLLLAWLVLGGAGAIYQLRRPDRPRPIARPA